MIQREQYRAAPLPKAKTRNGGRTMARQACLLTALAALIGAPAAQAATVDIGVGFDLFTTGNDSYVSITGLGEVPVIGVPFGPQNTDTVVNRQQAVQLNVPPYPATAPAIPIELVGLHLQSQNAIDLSGFGLVGNYFLHFTINREVEVLQAPGGNGDGRCDPSETCFRVAGSLPFYDVVAATLQIPRSVGTMEITVVEESTDHPGTYNGYWLDCFGNKSDPHAACTTLGVDPNATYPFGGGIFPDVWAVAVGLPFNAANATHLLNPALAYNAQAIPFSDLRISISCADRYDQDGNGWADVSCPFSTKAPPDDVHTAQLPAGGFYGCVRDGRPTPCNHDGPHGELFFANPEIDSAAAPAALALLLGGLALIRERRGRRHSA